MEHWEEVLCGNLAEKIDNHEYDISHIIVEDDVYITDGYSFIKLTSESYDFLKGFKNIQHILTKNELTPERHLYSNLLNIAKNYFNVNSFKKIILSDLYYQCWRLFKSEEKIYYLARSLEWLLLLDELVYADVFFHQNEKSKVKNLVCCQIDDVIYAVIGVTFTPHYNSPFNDLKKELKKLGVKINE